MKVQVVFNQGGFGPLFNELTAGNQVLYTGYYGGVLRVGYRRTIMATPGCEKYMPDLTEGKFVVYAAGNITRKGVINFADATYMFTPIILNLRFNNMVGICLKDFFKAIMSPLALLYSHVIQSRIWMYRTASFSTIFFPEIFISLNPIFCMVILSPFFIFVYTKLSF